MAIYHLAVKAVSRSSGRSATAAAAYRSASKIVDARTGAVHDYTRKRGVDSVDLVLPPGAPGWATDRAALWNAAELAEKRKDACVAREFEVALPSELSPADRRGLALDFAQDMADREGCAIDVAIHAPGKDGDSRNWHAHILRTTRKMGADGMGEKLDTEKAGRKRSDDLEAVRVKWAEMVNSALAAAGRAERVDHRSLKEQGIDREPEQHLGPAATEFERRAGAPSRKRLGCEAEIADRLASAAALGELERQSMDVDRSIIDLTGDLAAAKAERDRPAQAVPVFRLNPKMFPKLAKSAAVSVVQVEAPPPPAAVAQQSAPVVWEWYRGGYANSVEVDDEDAVEKVDPWHQRRLGWLAQRYNDPVLQERLQKLGLDIQWVSFPKAGDQVAALRIRVGGAIVVDDGRALVAQGGQADALGQRAALMVEIARAKGWGTIKINGDPTFVAAVRAAAVDAGLGVSAVNGQTIGNARPQPRGPGM